MNRFADGICIITAFMPTVTVSANQSPRSVTLKKRGPRKPTLFASDDIVGEWLLGPDRIRDWEQIAPLLEARGLPKVDTLMGGRYWPAVRAFFDHLYGLDRGGDVPSAPDGTENFEAWRQKKSRRS
jgi:hypothetical protein